MENLQVITEKLSPILAKNRIISAAVFGSYARGEENEQSDIDILIETPRPFGLIQFIQLKQEMESAIQKKVDLVTPNSLNKFIRPQTMKDLKYIYGNYR